MRWPALHSEDGSAWKLLPRLGQSAESQKGWRKHDGIEKGIKKNSVQQVNAITDSAPCQRSEPAAFSAAGADELLAERTAPGELLLLAFWRACRVDTGWARITQSTRFEGELVSAKRKISS